MRLPIYMDYHATTPLDPRVLEAMMPYLTTEFGNAASTTHPYGWHAEKAVEEARIHIAQLIGALSREIIFTSGATESNNLALKGVVEMYREKGNHIITQITEHKAVLDTCKYLEKQGCKITVLPVDGLGRIRMEDLRNAVTDQTILISIMFANNEFGTIQPIAEIGKLAKERGILFHTDAAQAAGRVPLSVQDLGVDLLSLSAHKVYAPKGVGILYVRSQNPRARVAPQMHGGGHENGMRSGTLNVPSIVGFGKAAEIVRAEMLADSARILKLRDRLYRALLNGIDAIFLNGHPSERLAGNLNISFANVEGDALINAVNEEVAISSGSACSSKTAGPSSVLKALGLPLERIQSSVRFGLGRFTTEEEVDYTAGRIIEAVKKLRNQSPLLTAGD